MKRTFARWMTALLMASLLWTPTAFMEADPVPEAVVEPAAEAIDETVEECEAELEDALEPPEEAEEFDLVEACDAIIESEDGAQEYHLWPEGALGDRGALFSGYVDQLFGLNEGTYEARNLGGDLTGESRALYNYLRARVSEVASGARSDTVFTYAPRGGLTGETASDILEMLIADCPYETYWFGSGYSIATSWNSITISLDVGSDYAYPLAEYTTDADAITSAKAAAANARAIVARHAGKSDYDKLVAYRDEICGAVDYNTDAVTSWPENSKDPWQLISVFDGDPATNVVCEGYAKAFQYLCDMSDFSGRVMCYSVTGYLDGGAHKWNVVRMPNGRNYLVDITACDQEGSGTYDWLFMKAPAGGSAYDGYRYVVRQGYGVFSGTYVYDSISWSIYTVADLILSAGAYLDEESLLPESDDQDFGAELPVSDDDVAAPEPAAASIPTIAATRSAPRTVTAAPGSVYQLDLGGKTGKRFKSSKKSVATVNAAGLVTIKKAGKTTLSFKVGAKTRRIRLTVKDPTIPGNVSIAPVNTAVKKGETVALSPVIPEGANSAFKWKSSNKKVATVRNGVVTFKRAGRVTITCTAVRGGKKAKVTFRVAKQ